MVLFYRVVRERGWGKGRRWYGGVFVRLTMWRDLLRSQCKSEMLRRGGEAGCARHVRVYVLFLPLLLFLSIWVSGFGSWFLSCPVLVWTIHTFSFLFLWSIRSSGLEISTWYLRWISRNPFFSSSAFKSPSLPKNLYFYQPPKARGSG